MIDQFEGKPISELLSAVIVPPQAFGQARALFGDIVSKVRDEKARRVSTAGPFP